MAPGLGEPWAEATDADGTVNRLWRIEDPAVHDAVSAELADAELLIADGHHRYETARVYADEIGGEGDHRYTLMCLVSLDDPGLTVFGTHRLLSGLTDDPAQPGGARGGDPRALRLEEVTDRRARPRGRRRHRRLRLHRLPLQAAASGCGSRTRPRSTR